MGPKIESTGQSLFLNLNASNTSASKVLVDIDPITRLPQTVTFASESRAEETATALGKFLGSSIALGVSGGGPVDTQSADKSNSGVSPTITIFKW